MIRDDVVGKMPGESARIRANLLDAKRIAVSTLEELVSGGTEYELDGAGCSA